jgi:hypothetical protein
MGQITGSGTRKAYASLGDDATLSRFVKTEKGRRHQPRQARLPGMEAPFIQEGRTKFPHSVKQPSELPVLLSSGHNNVKIGRDVRKGKFRGYWIYVLTLEERKTCPSSCSHWQSCYGNNMPFAKRVDHSDPTFLPRLAEEIDKLCAKHNGILLRLHALGDFYSADYVMFWSDQLSKHKNLAIYGYTAHDRYSHIGAFVHWLNRDFMGRCWIRYSNGGAVPMSTITIGSEDSCPKDSFICPEQTGRTAACATCGACWATTKRVAFLEH